VSEVSSRPVRVTFFEDRAEVLRIARVTVQAGATTVRIAGVTPLVHDPSLQVRAPQPLRVLTSRVVRRVEHEPPPSAAELKQLDDELTAALHRRLAAESALSLAHGDQQRGMVLEDAWVEAIRRVPDRGAEQAASLHGALVEVDALLVGGLDAAHAAAAELEAARLDEQRALDRLQLAQTARPKAVTLIEVQLEAPHAQDADLELAYQTPCAVWRPEHLARLLPAENGSPERLEIRTWATAWQRTGEAWADVPCRFSTARPAQAASPPLLTQDVLQARRKTAEEKKTVVVEAREQAIEAAGLDRGVRAVEEMPGVEDGGEPLWFEGARPSTVQSDGQPVRVEVCRVELPCTVERVAFPEVSPMVHVRATATHAGKAPLLAGPVLLVRGTEAVGRGRTRFVGKGEPFELGFGVDDGLRVRRQHSDERETVPLIGTQKITRTVKLFVSNLGGSARKLAIAERVPVSEIEAVEIKVLEGAERADADGIARLEADLAPGATKELTLRFRVEAAKNVQLPL
jgi:uncharacterized protein (TIGR02231 family)